MMADQSEPPEDLRWLLEPPAPGEAHVHIAVGEGTRLTPALREALEELVRRLHEAETESESDSEVSAYCRLISCPSLGRLHGTCRICRLG
jgi:hypothetical protein